MMFALSVVCILSEKQTKHRVYQFDLALASAARLSHDEGSVFDRSSHLLLSRTRGCKSMIRHSLVVLSVLLGATAALAQPPKPIRLYLSPAKPPSPPLRYRLLPDGRETIAENAAPIYQEVHDLLAKRGHRDNVELFSEWEQTPPDRLPKDTMRKVLAGYDDVF